MNNSQTQNPWNDMQKELKNTREDQSSDNHLIKLPVSPSLAMGKLRKFPHLVWSIDVSLQTLQLMNSIKVENLEEIVRECYRHC